MDIKDPTEEEIIAEKIITASGYFEENSYRNIAKTCAKLMVSEKFDAICAGIFKLPPIEEMEQLVLEEISRSFEERVLATIEQLFPNLTDEEVNEQMNKLEKMYAQEQADQKTASAKAAIKEVKIRVIGLQKEIKALKQKYTT
ncbi:MAG: hypothetical protein HQK76_03595 [Desulfobacterales bacterium]|nr:hypothetical protein [Desulfobacterales bacterium]